MNLGDILIYSSIWLALALYTGAEAGRRACGPSPRSWARPLFVAGAVCYALHVFSVFNFFHHWSHDAAHEHTAHRTGEVVDWSFGGGVFVNYVFSLLWLSEAAWWGFSPRTYLARPRALDAAIRFFFFFMIFNGAVVFVPGPRRWLGIALVVALIAIWWRERRSRPKPRVGTGALPAPRGKAAGSRFVRR